MKILYVNTLYFPDEVGGAERSVRLLAEAMATNGHEVRVLSLGDQNSSSEKNGVSLVYSKIRNIYHPFRGEGGGGMLQKLLWHSIDSFNFVVMNELGKVLDEFRPDVVHSNNISGFSVAVWQAAKSRGIPVVHTLRDYYLLCPRASMFKNGSPCKPTRCVDCKVLSQPKQWASKKVNFVVGNSSYILGEHVDRGYFPAAQKSVIFNAYETTSEIVPAHARPSIPVFGYIGRLDETKGLEYLIRSFRKAFQPGANLASLLIAGQGDESYVSYLKEIASDASVKFLGRVKPDEFYPLIHYTVLPALWAEPLARVLFESFVHGVPVIATRSGGTPEVVIEGVTGHLVEPGAVDELASVMASVMFNGNTYEGMIASCVASSPKFTYEQVAKSYLEVYSNAIC